MLCSLFRLVTHHVVAQSLIEYSEETKKGKKDFGTVTISAAELAALRAEAAKKK